VDRRDKLIRSGLELASELELETVLQRIVELAVELTDATYGALGVLETDGSIAEFVTTGITPEQQAAIGDPPRGRGILGLLIREARPRRIPRISEHPESAGFPPNHPLMTSFLGAPVTARGKVLGNIYLTDKRGSADFDEADEEAIVVFGDTGRLDRDGPRLRRLERLGCRRHDHLQHAVLIRGLDLGLIEPLGERDEPLEGPVRGLQPIVGLLLQLPLLLPLAADYQVPVLGHRRLRPRRGPHDPCRAAGIDPATDVTVSV
jgi:GAF domain